MPRGSFDQEIVLCLPQPLFLVKPCAGEVALLCAGGAEPQLASLSLSGTFDHSSAVHPLGRELTLGSECGKSDPACAV